MDLKNLMIYEVIEVSKNELKYKIMDLDSIVTFEIVDTLSNPNDKSFIKSILADNGISFADGSYSINRINMRIEKNPLIFEAVYLTKGSKVPESTKDLVIIPNTTTRALLHCKDMLRSISLSIDNINGEEY